jgi:hypothetical protein
MTGAPCEVFFFAGAAAIISNFYRSLAMRSGTLSSILSAGALALPLFTPAAFAGDTFYGGRAIGFLSTAKIGPSTVKLTLADNTMSCQGLPKEETIADASNPAPLRLSSKTITTYTLGVDRVANADAAAQQLYLEIPGLKIDGDSFQAHAESRCDEQRPGKSIPAGSASVGNLTINGKGQAFSGQPNQRIEVPNVATIILNEQAQNTREFRVNAMHVILLDPKTPTSGDIIVSSAKAKTDCRI